LLLTVACSLSDSVFELVTSLIPHNMCIFCQ